MSFDGFFLHHMVQELKAELLSGRIQKLTNPSSKNWCSKSEAIEKPKTLALCPFCLRTDSTDPDQL